LKELILSLPTDPDENEPLTGAKDLKIEGYMKKEVNDEGTVYFIPQSPGDYQINVMLAALIAHGEVKEPKFKGKFPKSVLDPARKSSAQCLGTTTRNKRCKNKTLHPSSYCHLHVMQCVLLK